MRRRPRYDPVLYQIADVGIAPEKPQQLVNDAFDEHLLGGQQRKSLAQIEAHLVAEYTLRARARAVVAYHAVAPYRAQQIEILFHFKSNVFKEISPMSSIAA